MMQRLDCLLQTRVTARISGNTKIFHPEIVQRFANCSLIRGGSDESEKTFIVAT